VNIVGENDLPANSRKEIVMGKLEGKVAFITGAARGQGRSHARLLASEGADIVALDVCHDLGNLGYPMGTSDELEETVKIVEGLDRRIISAQADVRDYAAIESVVSDAYDQFGHIDIVVANAGIVHYALAWEMSEEMWDLQVDVLLKGVWNTCRAVIPGMIDAGRGGSIVITSSLLGLRGMANTCAYSAAKGGCTMMAQSLAQELAPHMIRVNTIHPTAVRTDINFKHNQARQLFRPDLDHVANDEEFSAALQTMNLLPIPYVEPIDISNAVLFLVSDDSRYVTGLRMAVDAGALIKP
jgi:(+)-trans-carveol dehydrogenase